MRTTMAAIILCAITPAAVAADLVDAGEPFGELPLRTRGPSGACESTPNLYAGCPLTSDHVPPPSRDALISHLS